MSPGATRLVLAAPTDSGSTEISGLVGVDMKKLAEQIHSGVAGTDNPQQVAELRKVIDYGHSKGHDFTFVVVDTVQPRFTLYRDIATHFQSEVGGTVIVLGPNSVGSSSPDFSRVIQEQATDNLTLSNPPVAARQMVDSMTGPNLDWTVITLLLILVVVIGAVIARVRSVRARATGRAGARDRTGDGQVPANVSRENADAENPDAENPDAENPDSGKPAVHRTGGESTSDGPATGGREN